MFLDRPNRTVYATTLILEDERRNSGGCGKGKLTITNVPEHIQGFWVLVIVGGETTAAVGFAEMLPNEFKVVKITGTTEIPLWTQANDGYMAVCGGNVLERTAYRRRRHRFRKIVCVPLRRDR
jgi:hypothetical protein